MPKVSVSHPAKRRSPVAVIGRKFWYVGNGGRNEVEWGKEGRMTEEKASRHVVWSSGWIRENQFAEQLEDLAGRWLVHLFFFVQAVCVNSGERNGLPRHFLAVVFFCLIFSWPSELIMKDQCVWERWMMLQTRRKVSGYLGSFITLT